MTRGYDLHRIGFSRVHSPPPLLFPLPLACPQHPKNAIPSPKSQKTPDLHGQPENGCTELHGSKRCGKTTACCLDKGAVLTKRAVCCPVVGD